MKKRPFILLTNDDGVHAKGIKHLWQALDPYADLAIVAPATEQSAVGLSITIRHPLRIEKINLAGVDSPVWSVNGTPADCVKMATSIILSETPDLIVSGINRGSNAGRNVLYSGTVAGVVEGVLHNIPGIALSMVDYFNPGYLSAEKHIPSIIDYILAHPLPHGTFLNVNFPHEMEKNFKGLRFTKQGREFWAESPEPREHPAEGSTYYWLGAKIASFEEDHESDIACLRQGYATAVPINISDLTHHDHFESHRERFETFVNLAKNKESTVT